MIISRDAPANPNGVTGVQLDHKTIRWL